MANTLKMAIIHTIQGLLEQGWSHRRIARELGIHRETVSRYSRVLRSVDSKPAISTPGPLDPIDPKPAISTLGSGPPGRLSHCRSLRSVILGKLEQGLSGVRIFQDLRQESGFTGSYSSVKRFVRRLNSVHPLPFRRIETGPGEEAQVDFGQGARTLRDGKKRRPHILRICLSYSRKCYSEAVWQQTTESFIRCLENAFRAFGGVPKRLVIDNLKAAVTKADWFDPELNPKIAAFARHYGIVILPTKPATPRHKGKIESGVKYVQNAFLPLRTFRSLGDANGQLKAWTLSVAGNRIHGTTQEMPLTRFVQTLLDRKDRMSMAVGLEVRVPFCDHRLVEYAFNIPWEMKTFDGREKSILRAATRDLLPKSISDRVKSPYPSTQDPAYEQALRTSLTQIMADKDAPVRALLDASQVKRTLKRPVGDTSPMYDRMGMELAVGLNTWLTEQDVSLDL